MIHTSMFIFLKRSYRFISSFLHCIMQECLCTLVSDDSKEVSKTAQDYLEQLISSTIKYEVENDIIGILTRYVNCSIILQVIGAGAFLLIF